MGGLFSKYPFQADARGLTMFEVSHVYQLTPEPPVMERVNDYIVATIEQDDLRYFSYFLHHTEPRLNGRVKSFLLREGLDRYDPERFLDYKQNCVLAMLECLKTYNPDKGAEFLTYAHHFIGNALLDCRMKEESGSFSSLDEYKNKRGYAVAKKYLISIYAGPLCNRLSIMTELLAVISTARSSMS